TVNGRWLVAHTNYYRNGGTGSNGEFNAYHAAAILDFNNTNDIWFFGSGCEPSTPPDSDWVYHVCGGTFCDTKPDVFRMKIADRASRSSYTAVMAHADDDWGHEYFPRVSTDGNWVVYGASDTDPEPYCHDHDPCNYEIFIHPLSGDNNNREQLTFNAQNDQWPHLYVGDLWGSDNPQLSVSPSSLSFGGVSGGANPNTKDVTVSNSGSGTLASVSINENAAWLNVAVSGSGNNQTLTNNVDIDGMSDGTYNTTVEVSCSNASNSPQNYSATLVISQQAILATIEVGGDCATILPNSSCDLTASAKDQFDAPFAAEIAWQASGGGSMNPQSSGASVTEHTSTFTSDGSQGDFIVTAQSGGVSGTTTIHVSSTALPLRINCGSNDYDVNGWERDDLFVSGGADWINPDTVDTSGVENAAPPDVYKSVRHASPHSFSFSIPDGSYLLRLHFADKYTGRSMNYFVEGQQILTNFDIASEVGINKALVKDFQVTISDGDGMQILAESDGDVFEAGLEILATVVEEPQPDGDGGQPQDGGPDGGDLPAADTTGDGGGDLPAADTNGDEGDQEIVVSGGCSGCASMQPSDSLVGLLGLVFLLGVLRRR
ncbi:MAG: hypothetical protein JRJ19_14930, partial [Deltaproteobacteria bacterium]|nr:hypothetical protein [Deltaproteobacteria bacterium]